MIEFSQEEHDLYIEGLHKKVEFLTAEVEQYRIALTKIRDEPGDARDCRYIAGHALAPDAAADRQS